ncbi:hypothetical protein BC835DRAFT_1303946 [Cytidiella melzeri]|nr:hypothetical protein BC835DRAFT_1303946 [Cytidiella melzeri]
MYRILQVAGVGTGRCDDLRRKHALHNTTHNPSLRGATSSDECRGGKLTPYGTPERIDPKKGQNTASNGGNELPAAKFPRSELRRASIDFTYRVLTVTASDCNIFVHAPLDSRAVDVSSLSETRDGSLHHTGMHGHRSGVTRRDCDRVFPQRSTFKKVNVHLGFGLATWAAVDVLSCSGHTCSMDLLRIAESSLVGCRKRLRVGTAEVEQWAYGRTGDGRMWLADCQNYASRLRCMLLRKETQAATAVGPSSIWLLRLVLLYLHAYQSSSQFTIRQPSSPRRSKRFLSMFHWQSQVSYLEPQVVVGILRLMEGTVCSDLTSSLEVVPFHLSLSYLNPGHDKCVAGLGWQGTGDSLITADTALFGFSRHHSFNGCFLVAAVASAPRYDQIKKHFFATYVVTAPTRA